MANRAYLYSNDAYEWRPIEPYFNSRWNIPLAWFFFYSETNIFLADVKYEDDSWEELKLVAQKDQAVKTFTDRIPLLSAILQHRYNGTHIDDLLGKVTQWSGSFLLLDPQEVFGGGGYDIEFHIDKFTTILRQLAATDPDHDALLNNLLFYSGEYFDTENDQLITVIGNTYW